MLKISGASDDIVCANIKLVRECSKCGSEIEEPTESAVCDAEDEIGCYDQCGILTIGAEDAGVVVEMIFANTGVWAAKIHQLGSDIPIPWPISIGAERGTYTVIVSVDCPDGTPVKIMKRENP